MTLIYSSGPETACSRPPINADFLGISVVSFSGINEVRKESDRRDVQETFDRHLADPRSRDPELGSGGLSWNLCTNGVSK
jgi:hypothetical protein